MHTHPLRFLSSFVLALGLFGCGSGSADANGSDETEGALERNDTYDCAGPTPNSMGAKLTFDRGGALKSAVLLRLPVRGFPESKTFDPAKADTGTGQNSEQEFMHFTWDLPVTSGPLLEAEMSYQTKEKKDGSDWKSLSLDDSLLGEQHTQAGEPYGKLRIDIQNPDADGALATDFLFCKNR